MGSLWMDTAALPSFEPLKGNLRTDVLIIGGGMAGILCAYRLTQAGVSCALVEAGRLCGGVTGHTTAKLTAQHGLIYSKLLDTLGPERARLYLEANRAALEEYRTLAAGIPCDFQEKDAYLYSLAGRDKLEREQRALEMLGQQVQLVEELPLPFPTAGALKWPGQAQFHPLKLAAGLVKQLQIFEQTKVLELEPGGALTNHGRIRADKIIITTHFPMLNKHGGYFLKLYQQRSYVLALQGCPDLDGMYLDEAQGGLSFRWYQGLLLFGGRGNRTGKPCGGWQELRRLAQEYYPQCREVGRWAAQDCMTLDGSPYIGPYSRHTKGLYVATGFQKWGMTASMAAAGILSSLVQGKDSPYAPAFRPFRRALRPQLAANALQVTIHLLTPTVPRCPHMGCALKYNQQEHSWDCPCHGSRFSKTGQLLDNPACADAKWRRQL